MKPEYWSVPHFPEPGLPGASIVGVEALPKDHIESIQINPQAVDMLPRDLKYLASPDFLVESSFVTVPAMGRIDKRVLVPNTWKRALPIGYGEIPYGHVVGSTVMSKGGWISGEAAATIEGLQNRRDTPWGLFGDYDAMTEISVSNILLNHDFRSALTLGYVIPDTKKMRAFLESRWGRVDYAKDVVKNGFDLVKGHKQTPVILFRVSGVTERVHVNGTDTLRLGQRAEFRRASRSLVAHSEIFPDHFTDLAGSKQSAIEAVVALRSLYQGETLGISAVHAISEFCLGMIARNVLALQRSYNQISGLYPYLEFKAKDLGHGKDLSVLDYIAQDYEAVFEKKEEPLRPTKISPVQRYMDEMCSTHEITLRRLEDTCGTGERYKRIGMTSEMNRIPGFNQAVEERFRTLSQV